MTPPPPLDDREREPTDEPGRVDRRAVRGERRAATSVAASRRRAASASNHDRSSNPQLRSSATMLAGALSCTGPDHAIVPPLANRQSIPSAAVTRWTSSTVASSARCSRIAASRDDQRPPASAVPGTAPSTSRRARPMPPKPATSCSTTTTRRVGSARRGSRPSTARCSRRRRWPRPRRGRRAARVAASSRSAWSRARATGRDRTGECSADSHQTVCSPEVEVHERSRSRQPPSMNGSDR